MPHYPSDSPLIKDLFRKQLAEQEDRSRKDLAMRTDALKRQLEKTPDDPQVYLDLARCYAAAGEHLSGVATLEGGAVRLPLDFEIHYALLRLLQKCGMDREALVAGERACHLLPDDFILRLEYELYLPKLYDSEQEIYFYHRRYQVGLEKCIAACDLETREGALRAARGFSRYANFYLAYQGFDNLPLIRRYGQFVHSVMSAAYPQWSRLSGERPIREDSKPRVGYVSAYFRKHTVGEHFLGWLTQRDRDLYRAHCYYVGELQDSVTEKYRRASDSFFESRDLEAICEAIAHDQPDVLVFTDVGTDGVTSQIAALRLAPVQCAAYGHPITTGLPTIDYFISADLMEPPDGSQYYSEKLVTLPNLGICYPAPIIPWAFLTKTRLDFGLAKDAIVYVSCQTQFKYLPQYDHLFAEIALEVPNANFIFVAPNRPRGEKFLRRLEKAFSVVGLRAADFCHILPEQNAFDYWNLHLLSDVVLDTIGWSGGRSTLDAIACGRPLVTLRGRYARQRQSSAMLALLGVQETVTTTEPEYIAIAGRLGKEAAWRTDVASTMKTGGHLLFSEPSSVRALESFFARCMQTYSE
jgi:protein O-GlcNAc transferase